MDTRTQTRKQFVDRSAEKLFHMSDEERKQFAQDELDVLNASDPEEAKYYARSLIAMIKFNELILRREGNDRQADKFSAMFDSLTGKFWTVFEMEENEMFISGDISFLQKYTEGL